MPSGIGSSQSHTCRTMVGPARKWRSEQAWADPSVVPSGRALLGAAAALGRPMPGLDPRYAPRMGLPT